MNDPVYYIDEEAEIKVLSQSLTEFKNPGNSPDFRWSPGDKIAVPA
mgnify:CR=1 FL=1